MIPELVATPLDDIPKVSVICAEWRGHLSKLFAFIKSSPCYLLHDVSPWTCSRPVFCGKSHDASYGVFNVQTTHLLSLKARPFATVAFFCVGEPFAKIRALAYFIMC
jgi:hypothetical protein